MFDVGLTHVYFGDGQGKTSAAVGLAVRACGCGCRVLYVQFLKNCRSGELAALRQLEGVQVLTPTPCIKFYFRMTEEERAKTAADINCCFHEVARRCKAGEADLLVLDEAMDAVNLGIINKDEFLAFVKGKPANLELAITGHGMTEGLPELVDYISEVKKVKHPYDRGIKARTGADM